MSAFFKALSENKQNAEGEENWVILDLEGKEKLNDTAKGVGLKAFVEALSDAKIQYGAIKVVGVDNRETVTSKRPKWVQINWVGSKVAPMARVGALSSKSAANKILQGMGVTIDCNDRNDLTMNNIGLELLKSGGAHKPTIYNFGGEEQIELSNIKAGSK